MTRRTALRCAATAMITGSALAAPGASAAPGDVLLLSRDTGAAGAPVVGSSELNSPALLSTDGSRGVFASAAKLFGVTDTQEDVFVRDVAAGTTVQVTLTSAGAQPDSEAAFPSIDGAGTKVVFQTNAQNMAPGVTSALQRIWLRDLSAGTTTLVSRAAGGELPDDQSTNPSLSRDGRFATFTSFATNLVAVDATTQARVFRKDLQTGAVALVSRAGNGDEANGSSDRSQISGDGRFVLFTSSATNLSPDDATSDRDLFLRDLTSGTTTLVNPDADVQLAGAISDDGRWVAYRTAGATGQVWVRDMVAGTSPVLVSATATGDPAAPGVSSEPSISGDGRWIAFAAASANLPGGSAVVTRNYVKDRLTGAIVAAGPNDRGVLSISGDGCFLHYPARNDTLTSGEVLPTDLSGFRAFRRQLGCPSPPPDPPGGGGGGGAPTGGMPPGPPAPGPSPGAPAAARLPTTLASGAPSSRRCVSRRSFTIRVRNQPGRVEIVSATVFVNGRRVAVRSGARLTAPVKLKGLPKGRYTVKITGRAADGRTVNDVRKYKTCAPRRRR